MHPNVDILGIDVPIYGIAIIFAMFVLVTSSLIIMCRTDLKIIEGLKLGVYGFTGAVIGAKILYVLQQTEYSFYCMKGFSEHISIKGSSAYGAILIGCLFLQLGSWIHKIELNRYLKKLLVLVPICHAICKCGCFFAGCCYGIIYEGVGSVIYYESRYAPLGVALFPVQLLEAVGLILISIIIFVYRKQNISIGKYLVLYSILRFFIEFVRNQQTKVMIGIVSDIQIMCVCTVALYIIINRVQVRKKDERNK